MAAFRNWLLIEATKEFSSTQINLSDKDAEDVLSWTAKHIKKSDLTEKGIEDEVHITTLYGLHTDDVEDIKNLVKNFGSFDITLGKVSKFDSSDEHDVLKIEVSGDRLMELNKLLRELPHTSSFKDYKAHCTLAYVKKGTCDSLIGNKDFEGKKIKVTSIVYSSKTRVKTAIPLE